MKETTEDGKRNQIEFSKQFRTGTHFQNTD